MLVGEAGHLSTRIVFGICKCSSLTLGLCLFSQRGCHTGYQHRLCTLRPLEAQPLHRQSTDIVTSLTYRYAHLFGSGCRKIHSSERRKPSEVSMRLRLCIISLWQSVTLLSRGLSMLENVRGLLFSSDLVSSAITL